MLNPHCKEGRGIGVQGRIPTVFKAKTPYTAEITGLEGYDEGDTKIVIEHTVDVGGRPVVYKETFMNDEYTSRTRQLLAGLSPLGITGDNLGNIVGLHEVLTFAEEYARGTTFMNIRTREYVQREET